jgi:FkbM family methyltransferase
MAQANETIAKLRTTLLTSPEFRLKNPHAIPYATESNIVIKELKSGVRVFADLSDVAIGLNIVRGSYEVSELEFVQRTVKPGDTAVDLGGNIGFFALHLGQLVGPTGRVYAFEPLPSLADLLARGIAENRFDDRIVLTRAAVGEAAQAGHLFYAVKTMASGGSYLVPAETTPPEGHALSPVEIVALDDLELRRPVAFIKMDIEGAEPLACRGAERILRKDRPVILAELNPDLYPRVAGCTPTEFVAEMAGRGYDAYLLADGRPGRRLREVTSLCSGVFLPRA